MHNELKQEEHNEKLSEGDSISWLISKEEQDMQTLY